MQRPAPLSEESMLPQDYLGQWNSDLIGGCTMEPQGALLATACFCCRIGETWQQAGFMAFQYAALIPHFFFCCLPCIGTYFRGLMRQRFSIRRHTTTLDCFAWTVLPCCASVQEAKMVDAMCVVAMEEARAKEAADKRKADADAQRIIEAVSSKKPTAFRYGLSTNTGALRKPKGALEMVSQA
ncbi:unnamed protein product [Effrenium voratum]|uniref:PLAC8 family protein n=1 Tax=Effrenium voratum TaxID=2562239 RepID=A0AA36I0A1_9DINO|nr:unnamed protein product [Effrenium voratum]